LVGGRIDDLLLKKYNEENTENSPLVRLFHPVGSENAYYAETGLVAAAGGPALPNSETVWTVLGNKQLGVGKPVVQHFIHMASYRVVVNQAPQASGFCMKV